MSNDQNTNSVGWVIVAIGVIVLLIGLGIPSTQTHSAETCVDSPYGGQDCYTSSATTANPLSGWATGMGVFAIIGGIVILLLGSDEAESVTSNPQQTGDRSFAEQLEERQDD
ncbi:hypothetical protein [Halovivax asiaticus]|uniref:hypothetical protein n=1 Tax=Halovivax asiaticus TaxID=332953 RepID=UPI0012677FE0|nr:hypothetical protein [Halovivax asiaticus]